MCMPATDSDQPSLAYSSSSSSFASQQSSTPPYSLADDETIKPNSSQTGVRAVRKFAFAYWLCISLSSVLLIVAWSNSFPSVSSKSSCSSSINDNDPDSCLVVRSIDSKSNASDVPSKVQHRGKVIGVSVKASDLAAAYQSIKSEYTAIAHKSSTSQWQLLSSHADGSEVSLLDHPTDPSCPYVRMTSIMPGTVPDVWDFLDLKNWQSTMPKMDPYYEGLTDFGDYKHKGLEMKMARKKTKRLVTFGKRDFTFLSVAERLPGADGWVSGTVSVVTDRIPREQGYVRAYQDSISYYKPMDNDGTTGEPRMKLTMMFRLDLNDSRSGGDGGNVPMWLYVKTAGKTAMASVQNMKRLLELNAREKRVGEISEKECEKNWLKRIRNRTQKC